MAKNPKKSKAAARDGIAPGTSIDQAGTGGSSIISETSARAKIPGVGAATRKKSDGTRPGASIRKAAAGEKPKKTAARKKSARAEVIVSDDDIRLRAYFISEWRIQSGIEGDSTHDWWEARRQLQEEAKRA